MSTNGIKSNEIMEMKVPDWGESLIKSIKSYQIAQDEMNEMYNRILQLDLNKPNRKGEFTKICE